MDEKIQNILKTVAYGALGEACGSVQCLYWGRATYCNGNFWLNEEVQGLNGHEPNCIIRHARQILAEQGTPIKLYLISFSVPSVHKGKRDQKQFAALAYSEEEAQSLVWEKAQIVSVVFVRDLTGEEIQ